MNKNYLIDTHTHINMLEEISIKECIINAEKNGIKKLIIPSAYPNDFDIVAELTEKYENIYGMLGVHPSEVKDWNDSLIEKISDLVSKNKKIVAIGEIGLDYYWDKSFNELQKDVFIKQIKLANSLNLPIDIHDRDAHKDTYEILKEYNKTSKVVMHCYSGSKEFAKECIKEGYYLGIGGVVTFKNAKKLKEVVEEISLENIILETDAPYLTPVPYRGKENQPAYVKYVAEEIAKIKNISIEEVTQKTTENAERIFKI